MIIKKIYLKNYIYFKNSNLSEIDVEFNDEKLVWVSGDNGMGKSSFLLLVSSPFGDVGSSYPIMSGEEGMKIVEYLDNNNGIIYEVKHVFLPKKDTHTCKSFFNVIHPDGTKEELNVGGKVRKFYDIVYEKLGISKDNNVFGIISAEDKGIISKSFSERRESLKTFLSSLNHISDLTKSVNNKFIGYNERERNLKKMIEGKCLDEVLKNINIIESEISVLEKNLNQVNYDQAIIGNSDDSINNIFELDKKIEDLKRTIVELNMALTRIEHLLGLSLSNIDESSSLRDIERSILEEFLGIKSSLEKNRDKMISFMDQKEKIEKEILFLEEKSKNNKYKNELRALVNKTPEEIRKRINDDFDEKFVNSEENFLLKLINFDESYGDKYSDTLLNRKNIKEIPNLRKDLERMNKDVVDLEEAIRSMVHGGKIPSYVLDEYSVPDSCKNNSCPYYMENKSYLKVSDMYRSKENEKMKLMEDIEDLKAYILELEMYESIYLQLSELNRMTDVDLFSGYDIKRMKMELDLKKNILKFKRNLEILKSIDENDLGESVIETKRNELENLENKIYELSKKVEGINNDYSFYSNLVSGSVENIHDIKNKKEIINNIKETSDKIAELNSKRDTILKREELLKELSNRATSIKDTINTKRDELDDLKKEVATVEYMQNEYKEMRGNLKYINAVKDSLRKYIPVAVMDSFLEIIKSEVNRFMEKFNIPFQWDSFIVSPDTFRIIVSIKGEYRSDVSVCSSGERSIFGLAVNLALLKTLKESKYKVLVMDEIDLAMDVDNRKRFIDFLLGINTISADQIFMISHQIDISNFKNLKHIHFGEGGLEISNIYNK